MKTAKKSIQTTKLSSKAAKAFKLHLEKHLMNEEFKSLFLTFFEDNYEQKEFPLGKHNSFRAHFEDIVNHLFNNYTIELISWEQYCLSMKITRSQGWAQSKQATARKMLSELYHYILENADLDTKGFTELKEHKEFLTWEERSFGKMTNEDLFEKIGTNFPLESSLDQLHFIPKGQWKIKNNKSSSLNILNLNISKGEVKNLLIGFFLEENRPELALSQFVYLFRYSLVDIGIELKSITDFTFEIYEKQYVFFEKANKENVANTSSCSEKYRFTIYLTRFYKYLCKVLKEEKIQHNIFEGTSYTERNIVYYGGYKSESIRTVTLSSEVKKSMKEEIEFQLKDEHFKTEFMEFFKCVYSQQVYKVHDRSAIHKYFKHWLITILEKYTIELISWKQYCLSMKIIRSQNWCERGKQLARKFLSELYQYIIENVYLDTKEFTELKEHKVFLIWEERKSSKKMNDTHSEHLLDKIGTNFPLNSSLNHLHLIPGDESSSSIIINLNTSNNEIGSLLLKFYYSEAHSKHQNPLRQFIYLFRYSLMAVKKEPQSITDFTFEVFKKQYRFYQKVNFLNTTKFRKFSVWITRFYVFLCKFIKEQNIQHNIFEGTLYNERILDSHTFTIYYERGYRLIAYNPFEDIPFENRWLLISPDGYANARKNSHYGIDFLKVKDKSLRNDLKQYVWKQSSSSISSLAIGIYMVIEFLNFISSFKIFNELEDFINHELLEQWSFYIGSKELNTMNNYVKRCRAYLKFHRDKYQIPSLLIDILQQKPLEDDGGTPMTSHDIELFSMKFQKQRKKGIIGELSYIIFNLAATTKLRSGEILSLERDCILEKFERTGVIQYHSKTSGDQKIRATLTIEKINLIEKAIRLTADAHRKASEDTAKYIFIKEDGCRKDRIIEIVYQFTVIFSKIQKDLEGQLNNKYRPYNLRTTFIDNIYTEGINDGLPTKVIAEMVGNGEKTAIKYYRKTSEAQEYAEMFAGVTVSGVDVYGNILEEKDVENLNPVEDGLGGCKQKGCVNDEDEYRCLICSHFATTTIRIPLFKKRITMLKTHRESTLNSQERSVIDAQLKLYTAYYIKLINKLGSDQDVTDL